MKRNFSGSEKRLDFPKRWKSFATPPKPETNEIELNELKIL